MLIETVPSVEGGRGAVGADEAGADDVVGDRADVGIGNASVAVGGDDRDHREDAPGEVGPTGGGVVVGRVVERLQGGRDGLCLVEVVAVQLLQRAAGEHRTG